MAKASSSAAAATQNAAPFDVIIVGGGPAGAAAAITLAGLGRRVLVLEKHININAKFGESLPPVAVGMVTHYLGAIDDLVRQGVVAKTAGNASTWGSDAPQVSDFFYTPTGYGLRVERVAFDALLRNKAVEAGAVVKLGAQFLGCERVADAAFKGWKIKATIGDKTLLHRCRYLLDCSGRQGVVANALAMPRSREDALFACGQHFVSAINDDDVYTRIEATEDGWFYSNLLHCGKGASERVVVFHTDKNSPAAKQAATASGFMSLLEKTSDLASLLDEGTYQPSGKIRGACAASQRLEHFIGQGWAAVGDAAQAYDPLSSQGIYKALMSANKAGQLVHYALGEHSLAQSIDINSAHIQRYMQSQEQLWTDYKKNYTYFYRSEPRWPDQPFWHRRQVVTRDDKLQLIRHAS